MKTAFSARIVFGASAVLFGVIALLWHDPDTWQTLRTIWRLPFGDVIGACLMVAQAAGGIGMLHPRTARAASMVLGAVYALFSLACLPSIFAAPAAYERYGSFFEQFALLCGALAVTAATDARATRSEAIRRAVRVGLGLCAVSFMLDQAIYFHATASLVPTWIPPNQAFWAFVTTLAFGLAAIALLIDRRARLATNLMALMIGLFGVLVWIPLLVAHPEAHFSWSEFALTCLIAGAAWVVAASAESGSAATRNPPQP